MDGVADELLKTLRSSASKKRATLEISVDTKTKVKLEPNSPEKIKKNHQRRRGFECMGLCPADE